MIIVLCGLAGSGTDTCADYLVARHGFTKTSFAGPLKDAVAALFAWDRQLLEGATEESRAWREQVDEWWARELDMPDLTPRKMLRQIGTDVLRTHFHERIWLASLKRRLTGKGATGGGATGGGATTGDIVITDGRFPNEIGMLRDMGARILLVERDPPAWFAAYRADADCLPPRDVHVSEYAWARTTWDAVLANRGSIEDLHRDIDKRIM